MKIIRFVYNWVDWKINVPIEIFGYKLRKADSTEIEFIKENVELPLKKLPNSKEKYPVYEIDSIKSKLELPKKTVDSFKYEKLNKDYRYWVFESLKQEIAIFSPYLDLFQLAFFLISKEIYLASEMQFAPGMNMVSGHDTIRGLQKAAISRLYEPIVFEQKDLDEFVKIYRMFDNLKEDHRELIESYVFYKSTKKVDPNSDFYVISMFAVIESLITHKPVDTGDSISRQLKNKLELLDKRLVSPVDWTKHFGVEKKEKLISKLYTYRSSIAHGNLFEFTNKHEVLKNRKNVIEFLEKLTKSLIIQSLHEPDLIVDLKKC